MLLKTLILRDTFPSLSLKKFKKYDTREEGQPAASLHSSQGKWFRTGPGMEGCSCPTARCRAIPACLLRLMKQACIFWENAGEAACKNRLWCCSQDSGEQASWKLQASEEEWRTCDPSYMKWYLRKASCAISLPKLSLGERSSYC